MKSRQRNTAKAESTSLKIEGLFFYLLLASAIVLFPLLSVVIMIIFA